MPRFCRRLDEAERGALRALGEATGLRVSDADLTIGTSAAPWSPAGCSTATASMRFCSRPSRTARVTATPCSSHPGAVGQTWHGTASGRAGRCRAVCCGCRCRDTFSERTSRLSPSALFSVRDWSAAQLPDEWPGQPALGCCLRRAIEPSGRPHWPDRPRNRQTLVEAVAVSFAVPGSSCHRTSADISSSTVGCAPSATQISLHGWEPVRDRPRANGLRPGDADLAWVPPWAQPSHFK